MFAYRFFYLVRLFGEHSSNWLVTHIWIRVRTDAIHIWINYEWLIWVRRIYYVNWILHNQMMDWRVYRSNMVGVAYWISRLWISQRHTLLGSLWQISLIKPKVLGRHPDGGRRFEKLIFSGYESVIFANLPSWMKFVSIERLPSFWFMAGTLVGSWPSANQTQMLHIGILGFFQINRVPSRPI